MGTLVWANVLHGAVGLFWVVAARRLLSRSSAELAVSLMSLCLVMPVGVALLHALDTPALPESWTVVRIERWIESALLVELPLRGLGLVLVGGTAVFFVGQELIPAIASRLQVRMLPECAEPRLEASLRRVMEAYRRAGIIDAQTSQPRIACLVADEPAALLSGVTRPCIFVSRGLVERVAEDQLDAIVAHEAAHWILGGNVKLLGLWLLRALQATSPAALIAFRSLVDLHEIACDALAVRATQKPAALASSILLAARPNAEHSNDAITELMLRGERALTKSRVRALLDGEMGEDAPRGATVVSALMMGLLLWLIR